MLHSKPLFQMRAGDLMSRDVVVLRENMPMADAAEVLLSNSIHGAPVVDSEDQCVGVLSFQDVAKWGARRPANGGGSPYCASYRCGQDQHGHHVAHCSLPEGACRLQRLHKAGDTSDVVCAEPKCVATDWQFVGDPATDTVARHMTAAPLIAGEMTGLREIARLMLDADVHRLIVIDGDDRPVGVVTTTDLIAALAYAESDEVVDSFRTPAFGAL